VHSLRTVRKADIYFPIRNNRTCRIGDVKEVVGFRLFLYKNGDIHIALGPEKSIPGRSEEKAKDNLGAILVNFVGK
ncbi:hypothetical protein LCGC14_3074280, partial [marine sediment metagenome]